MFKSLDITLSYFLKSNVKQSLNLVLGRYVKYLTEGVIF